MSARRYHDPCSAFIATQTSGTDWTCNKCNCTFSHKEAPAHHSTRERWGGMNDGSDCAFRQWCWICSKHGKVSDHKSCRVDEEKRRAELALEAHLQNPATLRADLNSALQRIAQLEQLMRQLDTPVSNQ